MDLLSVKEFAEELRKPESTIRTWIRRKEIPEYCYKYIGKTIFIKKDKFIEWFNS